MCQFDWAKHVQIFSLTFSLAVSTRVFLDKINIEIDRLSKSDCSPQCGWASPNQVKTRIEGND